MSTIAGGHRHCSKGSESRGTMCWEQFHTPPQINQGTRGLQTTHQIPQLCSVVWDLQFRQEIPDNSLRRLRAV